MSREQPTFSWNNFISDLKHPKCALDTFREEIGRLDKEQIRTSVKKYTQETVASHLNRLKPYAPVNGFHEAVVEAKDDPHMPLCIRQILTKNGDEPILKIQVGRTPVKTAIQLFLNYLSEMNLQKKQFELGYDQLYHTYLLITFEDSGALARAFCPPGQSAAMTYVLEKSPRVQMRPHTKAEMVDVYDIPMMNRTLTLNELLTTALNQDKDFYTYDALENNMCQSFVENVVNLNDLTPRDPKTLAALKPQDANALLTTLGKHKGLPRATTDASGMLDTLIHDGVIVLKPALPKRIVRWRQ